MLDDATVAAFLQRLGARRPARPTVAALFDLHARFVMSIPFENIDYTLRRPIPHGPAAIEKIVFRRRGGACYELNGSFAALLVSLGYDSTVLGARIFDRDELGPVLGHMCQRVYAEDSPHPWLVDVGHGRGPREPLRLDVEEPQDDPHGRYTVVRAPFGDLDLLRNGIRQYRIEPRPRTVDDFLAMAWWHCTAPESSHLQGSYCTRPTERGRITLSGDTLVRTEDGRRIKTVYATDAEILAAYREHFGVELDVVPPGRLLAAPRPVPAER